MGCASSKNVSNVVVPTSEPLPKPAQSQPSPISAPAKQSSASPIDNNAQITSTPVVPIASNGIASSAGSSQRPSSTTRNEQMSIGAQMSPPGAVPSALAPSAELINAESSLRASLVKPVIPSIGTNDRSKASE
ncbi:hypothetical protein HK102_007059, partial [Quaeritorhiza haematococci]